MHLLAQENKVLKGAFGHVAVVKQLVCLATAFLLLVSCTGTKNANQETDNSERLMLRAVLNKLEQQYPLMPTVIEKPTSSPLFTLGKELFFSRSLSGNKDVACASCHHPYLAGGDKLSLPVGESAYDPQLLGPGRWHDWQSSADPNADGSPNVARHAQSTFNSSLYNRAMFYDGRVFVLDDESKHGGKGQNHRTPDSNLWQGDIAAGNDLLASQTRFPVVSNDEMRGYSFATAQTHEGIRDALVARMKQQDQNQSWLTLFRAAFGAPNANADTLINFSNIEKAISYYQSTQVLIDNDWYAYIKGDEDALTDLQVEGALLFFNQSQQGGANCVACHTPPIFSDEQFHNIAVPQLGKGKQPNGEDFGRRGVTQKDRDRFAFRTPTLLNVTATAPYTHSGAFTDLSDVIAHHLDPVASLENYDFSFSNNPQMRYVSELNPQAKAHSQKPLRFLLEQQKQGLSKLPSDVNMNNHQMDAITAFLEALTDPCLHNQECLDVWVPNENEAAPDSLRLVAKIGEFTPPPKPVASLRNALITNTRSAVQSSALIKSIMLESHLVGCEVAEVAKLDNKPHKFKEVALRSGLTKRHHISWPLYNLQSAQRLIFSGGVAAGDVDGDCWPDIFQPTGDASADVLYRNNRDGSFSDISKQWGITAKELSNGVAMVDIDGDNDLDIITSNLIHPNLSSVAGELNGVQLSQNPTLYINHENQKFIPIKNSGIAAQLTGWSFAFADFDLDGDLDALTTHWRGPGLGGKQPNHLWENVSTDSHLEFVAADKKAKLMEMIGSTDFTFTGTFSDINDDGYPDLLMAADFETSQVYKNNRDGRFENNTHLSQINDKNGMGSAVADYDNDGDLDWFVSSVSDPNGIAEGNWGVEGNRLYNNIDGQFIDVTDEAGVAEGLWAWGACFADFNNDQWPDIFHVNGFDMDSELRKHLGSPYAYMKLKRSMREFENTPSRLFMSNQDGTFSEQSSELGITDTLSGRGVACLDYDRDGDVDILISNHQDRLLLYKNNASSSANKGFIHLTLQGLGKNSQAIGAKVYVTANGITQLQEVRAGGSFISSSPSELHFGLADANIVDEIRIVWPGPNIPESVHRNISINKFYTIKQTQKLEGDKDSAPLQAMTISSKNTDNISE
ncbi:FG-GAP-like repeat-containing protein [Aliiglaciecola sp. 3_MG-2023]|uniref:FG-GAP-like repeat-containing protein n=1 Tax=Aliiglaciecola sp. 3_MG-2023 TaxID=3062644 RepID=UPI0026E49473|nr:FG-GAP-like repeat-containing protein [Aliiglaciecola sp. 3_MG-2023]MDO6695233.1 FG-GAP-like repeat-containing protein [Aliiglaciecola sp. 3_MG-2023]